MPSIATDHKYVIFCHQLGVLDEADTLEDAIGLYAHFELQPDISDIEIVRAEDCAVYNISLAKWVI